jgi:hypothetical protein
MFKREKDQALAGQEMNFGNGFVMEFDNGYSISVQWHRLVKCAARNKIQTHSKTAEVLVCDENGEVAKQVSNATANEVAGLIYLVAVADPKMPRLFHHPLRIPNPQKY